MPMWVLCFSSFAKPVSFQTLNAFYVKQIVQVGSVLPHTSAVYFHSWCVIVEADGPMFMVSYVF